MADDDKARKKDSDGEKKDSKPSSGKKENSGEDKTGKEAEILQKVEEVLAFKKMAHAKAKQLHYKHFCHVSPWVRVLISGGVDFIDAILGLIPGIDMAGTFFATFAAYILWGEMGFLAAWEFLPKLVNYFHFMNPQGAKEKKGFLAKLLVAFTPSVSIVGIVSIIKEHKEGHVVCQVPGEPIATGTPVLKKKQLDPAWRDVATTVKEKIGGGPVIKRELDPTIRKLLNKIKRR